jgi:hypothetical protein
MTNGAKNRLQDKPKNRPQDDAENRPDIINPVCLCGVVDEAELKVLLKSKKQTAWCTRVRILGLLLLIDYILRHIKNGRISMSADLAHQFVSKLRKKDSATTITEPLLLLCKIGTLRRVHPAVFAHIKTSAVYCFADFYFEKRLQLAVVLTPKLAQKRACAPDRREKRLNRKFRWREKLLADLGAIGFSNSARPIISRGFSRKGFDNLRAVVAAIDGSNHFARVSERGQITTSLGSCSTRITVAFVVARLPDCLLRHFKRALEFSSAHPCKPPSSYCTPTRSGKIRE